MLNLRKISIDETYLYVGNILFLCKKGNNIFLSEIHLTKPTNCKDGCLYVDDILAKVCRPIDELDELYLILEE